MRRGHKLLVLAAASTLVIAACGSDSDDSGDTTGDGTTEATTAGTSGETEDTTAGTTADEPADTTAGTDADTDEPAAGAGGEFIDLGTFVGDPPEHLDPALNSTLDGFQVINAVYDGLTDIDSTDPDAPQIVPHVAESVEPNEDATEWTFVIREGAQFADGEEINATTFQNSWERAADLAGDYSYLLGMIEGGSERLDGTADSISGIVADDATRTLTVTLASPNANFDAIAGFQLFMPVPQAAIDAGADWENTAFFGNGPYMLETERTDEEIVLVPNEEWQGDFAGETWPGRLSAIVFRTSADPDTSFNAFEAGEGDNANIPPGRIPDVEGSWGNTLDVNILGSYHFVINDRAPIIGGEANLKLRQAISAAIDREDINAAVYNGSRTTSTGITPPGIPGFKEGICEFCAYDPDQAQALYDEWVAAGGVQDGPIPIQFNADAGHEPVVQIIIDNLAAIGIQAEAQPFPSETYFSELADGACVICRAGWFADYPTYGNFMFDLFHSSALDGNNYGFVNEEFDALVDEAMQTTDPAAQGELFNQAEDVLLNQQTMAIPINWYRGDYAYNQERVENFNQSNFGLVAWEQITVTD
jgi:ABC-type oligopeptide transport system substrate-binding subunit